MLSLLAKSGRKKSKQVAVFNLALLFSWIIPLLLSNVAKAEYAEVLGGSSNSSTLRNPLIKGASSRNPYQAPGCSPAPAIGDGSCPAPVIRGNRNGPSGVYSGYNDHTSGNIFHNTGSQAPKSTAIYNQGTGRYETKHGVTGQSVFDFGRHSRGTGTYEPGAENPGQTKYESGYGARGAQATEDYGQGLEGQSTYEYGEGNQGQKSYDYGQGSAGQGTYDTGYGNGGTATYAGGGGNGGSRMYETGEGNNGRSFKGGVGSNNGSRMYETGEGNNGRALHGGGGSMGGSRMYETGEGNGGRTLRGGGGSNGGSRMYETGEGNGGRALRGGGGSMGGSRMYETGEGNGGIGYTDTSAGNGGARLTETGEGNGGRRIENEGGTTEGAQGITNNGGPKSGAMQKEDRLNQHQVESSKYDFQGPLPTVRTFSRYLVILGVVVATVFVAMAAVSVVMGHQHGATRVIGAVGGLLLLLAGYTIWKIVQMNTFKNNSIAWWNKQAEPSGQQRRQNPKVNLPGQRSTLPESDVSDRPEAVDQSERPDPVDQSDVPEPPGQSDRPDFLPRDPMQKRQQSGPFPHRPLGPYTGHPVGDDRVNSYDIPSAGIVPEPPRQPIQTPGAQ